MGNLESALMYEPSAVQAAMDIKQEIENFKGGCKIGKQMRRKLLKYLAYTVPMIFKKQYVSEVEKAIIDKKKFEKLIEEPVCYFICGKQPDEALEHLKMLNNPSQLCGKVFDLGDPTYTCKDCAADPTCVFCHDCFSKSAHLNHRYRMHASEGNGGYCDCGDVEAWKKDPCCADHLQGNNYDLEENNPKDVLPKDILEKSTFLYELLLQYCIDLLLWLDNDSLPEELRRLNSDESLYLTMLFNDEVHTYEQVIRTLQQAVNCDKSEAIRYATIVDKEGRSLVYNGPLKSCQSVCKVIQTATSRDGRGPLRCEAMKQDIVAHQLAAIEILSLLNKITSCSAGLRRILCELSLNVIDTRPESLIDQIFKSDTALWKVARAGCHQLFMNAVLLDPVGKKNFAVAFAKNYAEIMKDFVKDDHEHGLSASSMSVQIFTVPTLAQALILENDLLKIVFQTFLQHINHAFTDTGHIDFQSANNGKSFTLKREFYILHDIGYLLHNKPETWTPELRQKFLEAFDIFARIMRGMQGMEQVVRKLASHVEYEPNWESGFLMQLWMMPVIEAMITWCVSDAEVLREAMTKCLAILLGEMPSLLLESKVHLEVDPNFLLVNYDVGTQPASVHMGLSRFIAGLLAGCTKQCYSLENLLLLEENNQSQRTEKLLTLLEYPLRTLVFAAQVSAGMWRRNGYAVLHQVSYYQNVRCVSEMYDKDIIMLQVVAALMDGNHFLTALLEKYNLFDWLRLGFEDTELDETAQRRIVVISEEFLLTVLAVLGERHVLGIGEVTGRDILRKEVVHRLALGPASRSEIVKNLPSKDPDDEEDCTFESQLDEVLKSVAEFRQPGLTGKGLYQLKPQCLEECGQYFYHYSRSEQSKALEQRRKECKKSNSAVGFRVPAPANFTKPFLPITKLFCCDKMAKILTVVLFRASRNESKITPDTLIEETLYIIALGLFEVKRKREAHIMNDGNFLDILTRTLGVVEGNPVTIKGLLEDIQKKNNNQEYSELVQWIVKMLYDELSHKNDEQIESNQVAKRKQDEIDQGAKADKERRARLAKEKREKVMAQMSQMQKSFIKRYENVLDLEEDSKNSDDVTMDEDISVDIGESVAVGPNRKIVKPKVDSYICILCQEKEFVTQEGRTIVMAAFVQRSKALSRLKGKNITDFDDYNPLFTPWELFTGVYTNSCGHVMHAVCWQKYFDSVRDRERTFLRIHFHPRIDVSKNEFLCPLCSSLCNTVIPLLPAVEKEESASDKMESDETELSTEEVLTQLQQKLENSDIQLTDNVPGTRVTPHHTPTLSPFRCVFLNRIFAGQESSNDAKLMVEKFSSSVHSIGLKGHRQLDLVNKLVMAWSTCSYTIQCTERLLEDEKKPLFALSSRQIDCINALVQFSTLSCAVNNPADVERNSLQMLSALLPGGVFQSHYPSILELDMFGVMVNLCFALQALQFHGGDLSLKNIVSLDKIDELVLKISTQARLTQILLCTAEEINNYDESLKNLASASVKENLACLWGKMRYASGLGSTNDRHKQPERLFCHVIAQSLSFLRCSALFFHFLSGVQPPANLTQQGIEDPLKAPKEVHAICNYLSLPVNIVSLLPMANEIALDLLATEAMIERWCKHETVKNLLTQTGTNLVSSAASPVTLIPLPREYSKLITSSSGFRCPMTGDISQNPTMCLICGEMLCSQSYCCQALVDEKQIGSCTLHAEKCNETVGIFLRIRDCQILLLYNRSKGCFKPSPYLDEYGEPDYKFRRGNPLYLSVARYDNLQKLWLSHLIPEEIVRQMEISRSMLSYEWSHF